jgi:hypothetical protein
MENAMIYVICNNDYPFMAVDYDSDYEKVEQLCKLFQWYDKANIAMREKYPHATTCAPIAVFYHCHAIEVMDKV